MHSHLMVETQRQPAGSSCSRIAKPAVFWNTDIIMGNRAMAAWAVGATTARSCDAK
jgi:hypothetical protein